MVYFLEVYVVLQFTQVSESLATFALEDAFAEAFFPLVCEVVRIGHMLDQTLLILTDLAALRTCQAFWTIIFCRLWLLTFSEMLLIRHVSEKSRLMFIVVSAYFASVVEVFLAILIVPHYFFVSAAALP